MTFVHFNISIHSTRTEDLGELGWCHLLQQQGVLGLFWDFPLFPPQCKTTLREALRADWGLKDHNPGPATGTKQCFKCFPLEVDASSGLWDTELTNTFLPSIDHKVDHRITDPEDTEYRL